MSLILVTGLDGSGKSTFLNRIEAEMGSMGVSILRLPTIDSELFKHNSALYQQCEFVNYLGKRADEEQVPSLKIIAMFASVLLFNDLHQELAKESSTVYCERHPLIDTLVYAKIYQQVLHPKNLDSAIAKDINRTFENELSGLIKRIPFHIPATENGQCYDLLNFLFDWFSIAENNTFEQLSNLFPCKAPDFIYYLDAPTTLLIERISERDNTEYHEQAIYLEKMRPLYLDLLSQINLPHKIISTVDWSESKSEIENIILGFNN